MNIFYTLKDMVSLEDSISIISGRGEIQSKLSTSSTISSPINDSVNSTFNCFTLYDGDGRVSLNFFGINISFTKRKRNSDYVIMWINDVQKSQRKKNQIKESKITLGDIFFKFNNLELPRFARKSIFSTFQGAMGFISW